MRGASPSLKTPATLTSTWALGRGGGFSLRLSAPIGLDVGLQGPLGRLDRTELVAISGLWLLTIWHTMTQAKCEAETLQAAKEDISQPGGGRPQDFDNRNVGSCLQTCWSNPRWRHPVCRSQTTCAPCE